MVKTKITKLILILLILYLPWISGCKDEEPKCETCDNFQKAFVIGFDNCAGGDFANGKAEGYIISVPTHDVTAVCYNFPDSLFNFPTEYFNNYQFNCYFPDSASNDFPVEIKFRYLKEEDKHHSYCTADILPCLTIKDSQILILQLTN